MKKKIFSFFMVMFMLVTMYPASISWASNSEIDGQIGPWDPREPDSEKPNFDPGLEVEGSLPQTGDYFTISVDVPINMEFAVVPNKVNVMGQFVSPKYTIINNGNRAITAEFKGFTRDSNIPPDSVPLYIERPVNGDKKVQIGLNLRYTVPSNPANNNTIELINSEQTLGEIPANQDALLELEAYEWELPFSEGVDKNAMSLFNLVFEFSIN